MQKKMSSYRQRGYIMPDGSVVIIYGEDAVPVDFVKQEWDNDVIEETTTTPHIESTSGAV